MMILTQQNSKDLYNLGTTIKALEESYFVQGINVNRAGGFIARIFGFVIGMVPIALAA